MKSYVKTLVDYRTVPFEKEITVSCPEEYIQTQMRHLTRSHKQTEAVTVLQNGDVAVLALESEMPKFNRPAVFVTVGGGLFDTELEEQLIGHAVGETFTATVNSGAVQVTVKQASRTVFPEPTDEMAAEYAAAHDDYADCTTVESYRDRSVKLYLEDEKNQAFYGVLDGILDHVLTHSDWAFDAQELDEVEKETYREIESDLAQDKKTMETLSDDEKMTYFGETSLEKIKKIIRIECERRVAAALWRAEVYGVDAKAATLDELEENDWSFLENYVEENLTIREEV